MEYISGFVIESDFDVVYLNAMSPSQKRYNIPSPRGELQRQLIQDFPSEKEAIIKFFDMSDKITTNSGTSLMVAVKVLPLWFVRFCDQLGLIELISPFYAANKKGTLDQVVKVN